MLVYLSAMHCYKCKYYLYLYIEIYVFTLPDMSISPSVSFYSASKSLTFNSARVHLYVLLVWLDLRWHHTSLMAFESSWLDSPHSFMLSLENQGQFSGTGSCCRTPAGSHFILTLFMLRCLVTCMVQWVYCNELHFSGATYFGHCLCLILLYFVAPYPVYAWAVVYCIVVPLHMFYWRYKLARLDSLHRRLSTFNST